jgi:hypothetical protein
MLTFRTEDSVGADPAPILRTNCAQRTLGFSSTRALRAALLDAGHATTGGGSRLPCASASAVVPGAAAWLSPVGALSTETLENVAKRDLRFSERQDIDLTRAKLAGCGGERERASRRKTWTVTRGNYFASDSCAIGRGWSRSRELVGNAIVSPMSGVSRGGWCLFRTSRRGKFIVTSTPW